MDGFVVDERKRLLSFICILAGIVLSAVLLPVSAAAWVDLSPDVKEQLGSSSQVILVENMDPSSFSATVHMLEKQNGAWQNAFPPFGAVIGKNGFAAFGTKREGDGRTPSGVFSLGTAFGYEPYLAAKWPYRQAAADDLWVDDPRADDYNRWVKKGQTKAASFEHLRREDDLYRYGLVVEYNTNPVVKGRGSAIFFHIWKGRTEPTLGCVAMPERDMLRLLRWLDPAAKPLVVMGTWKRIQGFQDFRQRRTFSRDQWIQ